MLFNNTNMRTAMAYTNAVGDMYSLAELYPEDFEKVETT